MTDAVVPSMSELTRSTDLPAADVQAREAAKEVAELADLSTHPGWRIVRARLEARIAQYERPEFDAGMPYEDVGREYLMSRQVASILQEVLDDVRQAVDPD